MRSRSRPRPRRRSSTASASTWTAGAGCRATSGRSISSSTCPSFHATLVENGVTRWKRKAIAGAIKTPTPQLSVMATGVILNPSWEVPKSIWHEVAGKPGYVTIKDKNGKFVRWSQPPGPSNALGQLKFVMYNPYNIYLHDTNARSRFNSQVRALCRTAASGPRTSSTWRPSCWATTAANGRRPRSPRRWPRRSRSRPISSSRCRSTSSISAPRR